MKKPKRLLAIALLALLSAFIGSANSSPALNANTERADSPFQEEPGRIPEPSTFVLFAIGLIGLSMARSQIEANQD